MAVIPRVRVLARDSTTVTSCPRLKAAGGRVRIRYEVKIFDRVVSISSSFTVRFVRSMLSRIVTLFPNRCVRVNNSRTRKGR